MDILLAAFFILSCIILIHAYFTNRTNDLIFYGTVATIVVILMMTDKIAEKLNIIECNQTPNIEKCKEKDNGKTS